MIETVPGSAASAETHDAEVHAIVIAGPSGAATLAGIATAIVVACWFAFYLFVFLPRGFAQ
jgi:hypothetical protein